MAQESESRTLDKVIVRLPDGMRDQLKDLARGHKRSLNAEIVARLAEFQELDARLFDEIIKNQKLEEEVARLQEVERSFSAVKDRFFDAEGRMRPVLSVPEDLYERVTAAAERSHRSVDNEARAALEEAYPAPLYRTPLRDLQLAYFQWHEGSWHSLDERSWEQFRSGEIPVHMAARTERRDNYFVVAVIDSQHGLVNLISHNYHIKNNDIVWAADDLLTDDEKREYNRLMLAHTETEEDKKLLKELREKMEPAFALPRDAVTKLREVLQGLAPDDVLDSLLRRVS